MFMKSMLPPKLSWYVRSSSTPRSSKNFASRAVDDGGTDLHLMSSPTIGNPASVNFFAHTGSDAMNTGSALTNAHPASIAAWA